MMKIKKVGLLSFAKIQTILMGIFGLFMGLVDATLSIFYGLSLFPSIQDISMTGMMGLWSLILMPLFYAFFGFVFGFFGALFYNLISKWVGGIEIELEEKNEKLAETKEPKKPVKKSGKQ